MASQPVTPDRAQQLLGKLEMVAYYLDDLTAARVYLAKHAYRQGASVGAIARASGLKRPDVRKIVADVTPAQPAAVASRRP